MVRWPVAALGAGDNHSDRDHFIELQPLFAGVHPGDRPAEDEAALAGGSGQRFTLGNSLFQLFVGVVKNILQRLLPYLGGRLRYRIVGHRVINNIVIVGRIEVRIDPAQLRLAGGRRSFLSNWNNLLRSPNTDPVAPLSPHSRSAPIFPPERRLSVKREYA